MKVLMILFVNCHISSFSIFYHVTTAEHHTYGHMVFTSILIGSNCRENFSLFGSLIFGRALGIVQG